MSQEAETLVDRKNSLLDRREIRMLFRGAAGKIKRTDAIEAIAKQLGVDKKNVVVIGIQCQTGKTDVHATFYVYNDDKESGRQLPRYMLLRSLPKEERKKIIDQEKAEKLKAKQSSAAGKESGAGAKK